MRSTGGSNREPCRASTRPNWVIGPTPPCTCAARWTSGTANSRSARRLETVWRSPGRRGPSPHTTLANNAELSGSVTWSGRLLGLTPQAEAVAGAADLSVHLGTLAGTVDFTGLEHWAADAAPGDVGTGTMWHDGDLSYAVAVRGKHLRADRRRRRHRDGRLLRPGPRGHGRRAGTRGPERPASAARGEAGLAVAERSSSRPRTAGTLYLSPSCPLFSDLTDRTAVVTGSTKGIGKAIARALAQHGARVVVSSRDAGRVEATQRELSDEGLAVLGIPCNIGRKPELEHLIEESRRALGHIDIVVGNAAINPHYGSFTEISDEAFAKIMATNVQSNLWLAQLVADEMRERRDGRNHLRLVDRWPDRLRRDRRLLHLQGRRLPARPQPRGRARAAQHPGERHHARPGADGFCAGAVGGRGTRGGPESPTRR